MKRFISIQNTALFVIALASTVILAAASNFMAGFIPYHLISAGVFAMLLGMALNPLIQKLKKELYCIIAEHSHTDYDKVWADSDRDYWMTSQEALEYGMIDRIFTKNEKA